MNYAIKDGGCLTRTIRMGFLRGTGINLYTYVRNNPTNWVDPDGQKPLRDWTREDFLKSIKKHKKNIKVFSSCKDIEKHVGCELKEECSNCCQALAKAISAGGLWHNWWAQCVAVLCL